MHFLTTKNYCNFNTYQITEILLVLYNAHVIPKNQDKFLFYINNYIDWNQFNLLYNFNWIAKGIQNKNVVAHKLELALKKATNHKLEVARKKQHRKNDRKAKNKNYDRKISQR